MWRGIRYVGVTSLASYDIDPARGPNPIWNRDKISWNSEFVGNEIRGFWGTKTLPEENDGMPQGLRGRGKTGNEIGGKTPLQGSGCNKERKPLTIRRTRSFASHQPQPIEVIGRVSQSTMNSSALDLSFRGKEKWERTHRTRSHGITIALDSSTTIIATEDQESLNTSRRSERYQEFSLGRERDSVGRVQSGGDMTLVLMDSADGLMKAEDLERRATVASVEKDEDMFGSDRPIFRTLQPGFSRDVVDGNCNHIAPVLAVWANHLPCRHHGTLRRQPESPVGSLLCATWRPSARRSAPSRKVLGPWREDDDGNNYKRRGPLPVLSRFFARNTENDQKEHSLFALPTFPVFGVVFVATAGTHLFGFKIMIDPPADAKPWANRSYNRQLGRAFASRAYRSSDSWQIHGITTPHVFSRQLSLGVWAEP
ncbi:hypothetical protein C8R45DRAFT_939431 [Mycena sanguinolenta]|nr:hypothetical protein C8R45DRAFT_939431 [Mycena sanguinolenta]